MESLGLRLQRAPIILRPEIMDLLDPKVGGGARVLFEIVLGREH